MDSRAIRTLRRKVFRFLLFALVSISIIIASLITLTGFAQSWSNFSQYPGFKQYYLQYPRSSEAATPAEQQLLQDFRPQLYVHANAEGPISFYRDYIGQGSLTDSTGKLLVTDPTPDQLNFYRGDPEVAFRHHPQFRSVHPEAIASVRYDHHPQLGRLSFLSYHFVFRYSGIVAGLPSWQEWLMSRLGDLNDWHQLDHYTAVTMVLNETERPIALILQQHNNERSYVLGFDIEYQPGQPIRLISAQRSNELYPWHPGEQIHRVVQFMTADNLPYLVNGENKPQLSGLDRTQADRLVDYQLRFLPPNDAFFSFAGYLGERRRLPGRDGPPGADYNTPPPFKRPLTRLLAFNWSEGDQAQMKALQRFLREPKPKSHAFRQLTQLFIDKLAIAATSLSKNSHKF